MSISPAAPSRMRFTRADYYRMAEVGILPSDARVELLDGDVVRKSPAEPRHGGVVDQLTAFFVPRVTGKAIVRVQGAIALSDTSEPEPDLALLKPRKDFYRSGHPGPKDVLLIIEVAESSLEQDLDTKLRLYAKAGIPEYWVIDLNRDVLMVHRDPAGQRYAAVSEHDSSARVSPAAFPDLSLDLQNLLAF